MPEKDNDKKSQYDELILENSVYYTEVPDSYKNRKVYAPVNKKLVLATIPGTIVDIYVKVGQKVEKNDNLLILEAMKMRNKIKTSIDGEIKSIIIKEGDIVRKDAILIELK